MKSFNTLQQLYFVVLFFPFSADIIMSFFDYSDFSLF